MWLIENIVNFIDIFIGARDRNRMPFINSQLPMRGVGLA